MGFAVNVEATITQEHHVVVEVSCRSRATLDTDVCRTSSKQDGIDTV